MPVTTVPAKVTGDVVTEVNWNSHIKDNLNLVKGILEGTSTEKIPGTAFASPLVMGGSIQFPANFGLLMPDGGSYRSRVFSLNSELHFAYNAYWDGTNWQRDDTLQASYLARLGGKGTSGSGDNIKIQRAAAGSGIIVWATLFAVDGPTGRLDTTAIWEPGEFYLGVGANNLYAHSIGAKPRLVQGTWGTATGNTPTACAHNGVATGATVRIDSYDATNVRLINDTGLNVYVTVRAIK